MTTSHLPEPLAAAARKARHYAGWQNTWLWWRFDLAPDRPDPELPDGQRLVALREGDDLAPLHALAPVEHDEIGADPRERMRRGGTPWVVLDEDGRTLMTCWTFVGEAPLGVLPSGWLALPDRVALMEDSIVAPEARGGGVAPRTAAGIAARLGRDGIAAIVTRIKDDNAASNRAAEKAGFVEVARMTQRHAGPRVTVTATPSAGAGPLDAELVRRIDGHRSWELPHRLRTALEARRGGAG